MSVHNQRKFSQKGYFRARNTWINHKPWYIYTTSSEIEQPFALDQLRDALEKKIGIRPWINTILQGTHEFYQEHDIPLISRVEPNAELFTVNDNIDLTQDSYRSIISPPQERPGRPTKGYQS